VVPHQNAASRQPRKKKAFAVVGLGASAGGLQAVAKFLENMPSDSGLAFVVILHLSMERPSSAPAILQRSTRMPVAEVTENTKAKPGHVYVIAHNKLLSMINGSLVVSDRPEQQVPPVAIDTFFKALGNDRKDCAFGVLLSGTGSDGALGVSHLKATGGVTFAQHPDDAEFEALPAAGIATGSIDFVLPVADIPQKLIELWENAQHIHLPHLSDSEVIAAAAVSADQEQNAEEALREIIVTLRKHTGHDFHQYKRATLMRRLERRLQVRTAPDLPSYLNILKADPAESAALFKDLLIGVTQFFRDREAFEALERSVAPSLFEGRTPSDPVRVWVAACSTGEEAYSMAMMLCDQAGVEPHSPGIQIFATDIDERAIATARTGNYPEGVVQDIPPVRLRRYFGKEKNGYRVNKHLREKVLFASHNLMRDPPFSKLDMISCRNLLIYLNRDAQLRILEIFHFALKPNGVLFLGSSESADAAADHFTSVDKKNRIYRANPIAATFRSTLPPEAEASAVPRFTAPKRESERKKSTYAELHDRALAATAPPSLIINRNADIVHMSDHAANYLRHVGGEPSRNLIALIAPELRIDLRSALFQAEQSGLPAATGSVPFELEGAPVDVTISAKPYKGERTGEEFTVVMFESQPRKMPGDSKRPAASGQSEAVLLSLEENLQRTKLQLQDTIEQANTSGEELKASNEELQSINEELRSATEELETGKEELQSVNEELTTVNSELKNKVDEVSKVNDDLRNLIASTDIATLFVDRDMVLRRYTPRATDIFNLIPGDVGRSLHHITHRLKFDELIDDAEKSFQTLKLVEREVSSSDGRRYLARMLPYRTLENRIEGALLTFIDITELRHAQDDLRASDARMRLVADSTVDYSIITFDIDGRITSVNRGAELMYGHTEAEVVGKSIDLIYTQQDQAAKVPLQERMNAREQGRFEDERWHVRKNGSTFFCSGVTTPLFDGQFYGYAKIGRDITQRVEADKQRNLRLQAEQTRRAEAQAANELKDEFLAIMSHELKHPLNLIHLNAEMLERMPEAKSSKAVSKAARAILGSAASQAKIIDDLLDFSRINTGKMALSISDVDLAAELESTLALFESDSAAMGLVIVREGTQSPAMIRGDKVRVNQIIANLVSNAIKFSRPQGRIVTRILKADGFFTLEVSDDGQGIDPKFLPTVFEMFQQSHLSATRSSTGLGIGLALVRQLAELHGGSAHASSPGLGQGATFSVSFPAATVAAAALPCPSKTPVAGAHILVVDDSPDIIEAFEMILSYEGAEVISATSAKAGLALLDGRNIDVIVSDIGMPGMDGYEFIQAVRKISSYEKTPAIALTGFGRAIDNERALKAGFTGFLRKPVAVEDLFDLIGTLTIPV
jgi:two-component system CheB/CheR fusion protein